MKIINPQVERALALGPIKLDLGAGRGKREGFFAVDHLPLEGVDILADLNEPLSLLPDNCCGHVYSRHVLEHVNALLPLMEEIHRITRPDGTVEIIVPHFSNVYGYSDPTHVRFFGLYSMYYFVDHEHQPAHRKLPAFYTEAKFIVQSVSIRFYRCGLIDRILAPAVSRLVNLNILTQDFYERRLSPWFHAWEIRYLMKPVK